MFGLDATLLNILLTHRLLAIPSSEVLLKHFAESLAKEIYTELVDGARLVTYAV